MSKLFDVARQSIKTAASVTRCGWCGHGLIRRRCRADAPLTHWNDHDIYAQFVPESQRRAVGQMMDMVTTRLAMAKKAESAAIN